MKKILVLALLITGFSNAQIVTIPDVNFKSKLLQLGVDTNSDGNIQQAEALVVTSLDVSTLSISSLSGIESFTNLTYLDCSNNNYITSLDLANLTNLTYLNCGRNDLNSLDVSMLTNLTQLKCYTNNITVLNVSALLNLTHLDCSDNTIQVLDVANLTGLTFLNCSVNTISVLAVDNLVNLTTLYCSSNYLLSNLNVGPLVNLVQLHCTFTNISSLNLSSLTNLTSLRCDRCPIQTLDFSSLTNLTGLNCGSPQLLNLDLSPLVNLEGIAIYNVPFTNVDLSPLVNLKFLTVMGGNLESLDASNSPLLNEMRLNTSNLHSLNIKNGGSVNTLYMSSTNNIYHVCCNESEVNTIKFQLSFTNTNLIANVNSNCIFFPFGDYSTISGRVSIDADANGCDSNDFFASNVRVALSDGVNQGLNYTNANGVYNFYPQTGSFVVTPAVENPTFFNFSPPSYTLNFPTTTSSLINDFCMTYNGNHKDVEVVMLPITTARPGFDAHYQIVYKNKGNQTLSGTVDLDFEDDVLDYVSSTINVNSQSVNNLSWNYNDLAPFETRIFSVVFNLNSPMETPAVNIGDQLDFGVTINPILNDEIPVDNVFGFKQFVVGSSDPNDKTCLEGNVVSTSKIGDYLHYSINFENVGNAAATFVVVKDEIDSAKFDMNSLQIMYASHLMTTRVIGNKIDFVFDDINLGPNQHGNVTFKIKTKSTLVAGNTVTNKANIYFDYNFPIETNTTSTTFQTLSNGEFILDSSVVIAPNPTKNTINVNCSTTLNSVTLFDVHGRVLLIQFVNDSQSSIDVSNYTNGIYFVKVTTEKGSTVEKIIKE